MGCGMQKMGTLGTFKMFQKKPKIKKKLLDQLGSLGHDLLNEPKTLNLVSFFHVQSFVSQLEEIDVPKEKKKGIQVFFVVFIAGNWWLAVNIVEINY
jgi:hypothetical protein